MRITPAVGALVLALFASAQAQALPPGAESRGFVDGANHHLGDAGFVAARGRDPRGPADEAERTKSHLSYARRWLGGRPATRPERAGKRAELLGYLDEYISKGATPRNDHLPWRNPVFIDDAGRICAVGYLIERSSGRAAAEAIAAGHRYDYLEDIAAARPEVAAWVEASGFTLEELASIQPGYSAPMVERWRPWDLGERRIPDGRYRTSDDDGTTEGAFAGGHMTGPFRRLDAAGHVVGEGTMTRGAGVWRSSTVDGKRLAEGPFASDRPHGAWRFFHPSGNLAAEGSFAAGFRDGAWRFYYDAKEKTPIAEGSFARGRVLGDWRHFDRGGRLLAVSTSATPPTVAWRGSSGGHLLDVKPGPSGVHRWVHQGNVSGDHHRLDMISDGVETIFEHGRDGTLWDAEGYKLSRAGGGWTSADCRWTDARKRAAKAGDLVTLHGHLSGDLYRPESERRRASECGAPRPVAAARAKRLERLVGGAAAVREPAPDFVKQLALGEVAPEDASDEFHETATDLARVLAANMTWYVEWPHVDGRFIAVFGTLPGYARAVE